jgi:hypothetical protein
MFYIRKLVNIKEKEKRDIEKASSSAREAPSQGKMIKGPGVSQG